MLDQLHALRFRHHHQYMVLVTYQILYVLRLALVILVVVSSLIVKVKKLVAMKAG